MMPKSPVGGPGGPGSSPMMSPGGGAGNRADAMTKIKSANAALLMASLAFEQGGKEQQAILRAVTALNTISSKAQAANLVPAGLAAMGQASKQGPLTTAPPPGVAAGAGGPPGMPSPEPELAAA